LGLAVLASIATEKPPVEPREVGRSLLEVPTDAVAAIALERPGMRIEAVRDQGRWRVRGPIPGAVPSDLIAATVATLTTGQTSEVMVESSDTAADFGLGHPTLVLEVDVGAADGRPVRVEVGGRNPTNTGLYARRADAPAIFLVGLNLGYYADLMFEAAAQAAPRAALRTNVAG
jgi:hypothetical protein